MSSTPRPTELRVSADRRQLSIAFDSGERFDIAAELLRVHSPSAEVQGHSAGERKLVGGKRGVKISQLVPTGNYAVRIVFDDGHDSGIFTWAYFQEIGKNAGERLSTYEQQLAAKGMSRDAVGSKLAN